MATPVGTGTWDAMKRSTKLIIAFTIGFRAVFSLFFF